MKCHDNINLGMEKNNKFALLNTDDTDSDENINISEKEPIVKKETVSRTMKMKHRNTNWKTSNVKTKTEYVSNTENDELYGNNMKLNTSWTVWIHRNSNPDWTISGYQRICIIDSIGSFWRFFNNIQSFNLNDIRLFLMREKIAPIWEDVNNKFGGICSLKVDSVQRGFKTDISTEVMVIISLMTVNETLISSSNQINGIEMSIKKRSCLVKLWFRDFDDKYESFTSDFIKNLPQQLIKVFNSELVKINRDRKYNNVSIQCRKIHPEYNIDE